MKRSPLNSFESNPKTILAQTALYYNMSNHYRRLYNAKPWIDNTTPKSYISKLQKNKEKNSSPNKACDPFTGNLIIQGIGLMKKASGSGLSSGCGSQTGYRSESRKSNLLDETDCVPFHPKISKTNVQSKLRTLRDYHPPRKKVTCINAPRKVRCEVHTPKDTVIANETDYTTEYEDDVDWLQMPSNERQGSRSSSKPSSSDSAYTEEGEGLWSGGESRDDSPQNIDLKNWSSSQGKNYNATDPRYVKFLRTITDEVLRKGIYTNKVLKKVFQEHIHKNRHELDVQRMQMEVEKLQEDLGIPKDDDLNDMDYGLGCGIENLSISSSDYGLKYDNLTNCSNRLSSTTDIPYVAELIDSIDDLHINSPVKEEIDTGGWLYTVVNSSNCNNDLSDNVRLPLKLPIRDNDNDSSIGCEILSGSSEFEYVSSSENNLDQR